ncbi:MAG: nucleotidyltransferase domain-containing protein [Candidatus Bathyarchaeia archaeon]|nr:nucleotidyltransferase domain-containing protein [Candidatus Bathyarchaeia archaeon]
MVEIKLPNIPYKEALKAYLETLFSALSPRFIVLYGSAARGDFGVGSDVDVLVVSDGLPERFDDRLKMLFDINPTTAPIEPVAYTPEEFEELLRKRHATALYAMDEGVVLYDDGLYLEMKEKFERLKKDLRIVKGKLG